MMLLPSVTVHLVSRGELRAADGAVHAIDCLLAAGPVGVFWRRMLALVVLVKFLARGKERSACLADELIACHRFCTPFVQLAHLLHGWLLASADPVPRR